MGSFKWEAPPRKRSGRSAKSYQEAKKLASRPNQWARIGTYKTYSTAISRAQLIRKGEIKSWNEVGTFEAKVRQTDVKEFSLYARCIYVKKEKEPGGEQ